MDRLKWHFEKRPVESLRKWDRNPREITEKPFNDLKTSISRFGLAEPIVIQPDGLIIGGHARYEAIKLTGAVEVDCYVPDRPLTDKEYEELNIRLNKNVAGSWSWDALANWNHEDLIAFGFDAGDLAYHFDADPLDTGATERETNVHKITMALCPACGHEFEVKRKKAKKKNDGTSADAGSPGPWPDTQETPAA
jgi:hypothetical protein